MKPLLLLILVISISFQVACTRGTESTTQAAREERTLTDADLKDQIQVKINSNEQLRDAISVSADADRNTATLSGTVESEALRATAVEMARAAHPGLRIEDKIDVKPHEMSRSEYTSEHAQLEVERAKANKETVGSSIDDAWIHSKIVAKLFSDLKMKERKINVDVDNNVVTLRGTIDSAEHKQEAERIAKETDGVKRVNNQLRISKG